METGKPAAGVTHPSPDLDEVLQEEPPPLSAVPVDVRGPVQTHELPTRRAQMKTDVVPIGQWTPLLPETLKRKRVILLSTDKPFYLSVDGTGATGMLWPANVPLTLTHTLRVFVQSADGALPATISHVSELWAD